MKVGVILVSMASLLLAGCQTVTSPTAYVEPGASPRVKKVTSEGRSLLACYGNQPWTRDASLNIAIRGVTDKTMKFTSGDYGEGGTFPSESITMALSTMRLATSPKKVSGNPLKVFPRGKDYLDTINGEGLVTIRKGNSVQVPEANYYLNATISDADSIGGDSTQVAVGPLGGGPSQSRYEVSMDIVLEDWKTGEVVYSTSVKKQYVQQEMSLQFADIMKVGGDRKLVTAQMEHAKRSILQRAVRDLFEIGSADILSQVQGTPATCNAKVRTYFAQKSS